MKSLESSPLLPNHTLKSSVQQQAFHLIRLATPIFATYALEFLPGFVSVALVGHLDSPYTKEY
ncbi:hypothetical protein THRCLA_20073, partial [Thraustotheca clavata]